METHAATLRSQATDARARTREAKTALATVQETCSQLRQQNAGLEAQLPSVGEARKLEQSISKLHHAVLSSNKLNVAAENSDKGTSS